MAKIFVGKQFLNWGLFLLLCLIWGSSFILMKVGLKVLTPYQVASLRIISAGLALIPFAAKAFHNITPNKRGLALLSGILGSFFPAFLFCIAETKINSAVVGMLNALTPLFVILTGIAFFKLTVTPKQIIGILLGFGALCLLVASGSSVNPSYFSYAFLVVLATLSYGINVNMVSKYMQGVGSLEMASLAFVALIIPCLGILYFTGYFSLPLTQIPFLISTAAATVLGIFGTAIASILFYMLVKRASGLFASTVTYGIPFVAIGWGIGDGELVNVAQILWLSLILLGVYLANKK